MQNLKSVCSAMLYFNISYKIKIIGHQIDILDAQDFRP